MLTWCANISSNVNKMIIQFVYHYICVTKLLKDDIVTHYVCCCNAVIETAVLLSFCRDSVSLFRSETHLWCAIFMTWKQSKRPTVLLMCMYIGLAFLLCHTCMCRTTIPLLQHPLETLPACRPSTALRRWCTQMALRYRCL